MTRIGLLSDTHAYLDKRIFEHFRDVDEIWHAGDIGSMEVLQALREFRPTRAVFGNMDGGDVRYSLSEFYRFRVEGVQVLMTHIGGYPGHYNPWLLPMFRKSVECVEAAEKRATPYNIEATGTNTIEAPEKRTTPYSNIAAADIPDTQAKDRIDLFVCGHSHILKVQYDSVYRFLTMNPGAAGLQGWQTVQTLLRFSIDGTAIKDLEVIELERR